MQLSPAGRAVQVKMIQEHERLQQLAEIAGAHQPRDRAVVAPAVRRTIFLAMLLPYAFFVTVKPCGV